MHVHMHTRMDNFEMLLVYHVPCLLPLPQTLRRHPPSSYTSIWKPEASQEVAMTTAAAQKSSEGFDNHI